MTTFNPKKINSSTINGRPAYSTGRNNAFRGFMIGAAVPLFVGVALLIQIRWNVSTERNNDTNCGTGALLPVFLILFGTPLGAICGLAAGVITRS